MFSVNSILNSVETSEKEDYYNILKCDETATIDQINAEFKLLALESHPDKNPDDANALKRFQTLQEARNVLTDPKLRRDYDKWRASEVSMSFKQWQALGTRCQTTMHWAKPRTQGMLEQAEEQFPDIQQEAEDSRNGDNPEKCRNDPTIWRFQSENQKHRNTDDVYRKFRNYQI